VRTSATYFRFPDVVIGAKKKTANAKFEQNFLLVEKSESPVLLMRRISTEALPLKNAASHRAPGELSVVTKQQI